jgi:hypothetical protein
MSTLAHRGVVAGLCFGVVAGFLVPLAMSCGDETYEIRPEPTYEIRPEPTYEPTIRPRNRTPTYNPMDDM